MFLTLLLWWQKQHFVRLFRDGSWCRPKHERAIQDAIRSNPHLALAKYQFCEYPSITGLESPIKFAVKNNFSAEIVEALCDAAPELVREKHWRGETILHYSCNKAGQASSVDVVRVLMDKYPEALFETDLRGNTPLHCACDGGRGNRISIHAFKLLIDRYPLALSMKNVMGSTPLHCECGGYTPNRSVIRLLVNGFPAAVKETDKSGATPLHNVCSGFPELSIVKLLLDTYPDVVQVTGDWGQRTPLHNACGYRGAPIEVVRLLVGKYPKALRMTDAHGETPLSLSSSAVRELLLKLEFVTSHCPNDERLDSLLAEFLSVPWWGGAAIILDTYPASTVPALYRLNLNISLMVEVLLLIGGKCCLATMFHFAKGMPTLFDCGGDA